MPVFSELDPELAWKLIEGYEDTLSPEAKAQEAFYRQFRCPRCKQPMNKEFDGRHAFSGDSLVARALLRCGGCDLLLEPDTGLVLESGNPAKALTETTPVIRSR